MIEDRGYLIKTEIMNWNLNAVIHLSFIKGEAVQMVADGKAPKIAQTEEGATYDPMIKKETVQVKGIIETNSNQ